MAVPQERRRCPHREAARRVEVAIRRERGRVDRGVLPGPSIPTRGRAPGLRIMRRSTHSAWPTSGIRLVTRSTAASCRIPVGRCRASRLDPPVRRVRRDVRDAGEAHRDGVDERRVPRPAAEEDRTPDPERREPGRVQPLVGDRPVGPARTDDPGCLRVRVRPAHDRLPVRRSTDDVMQVRLHQVQRADRRVRVGIAEGGTDEEPAEVGTAPGRRRRPDGPRRSRSPRSSPRRSRCARGARYLDARRRRGHERPRGGGRPSRRTARPSRLHAVASRGRATPAGTRWCRPPSGRSPRPGSRSRGASGTSAATPHRTWRAGRWRPCPRTPRSP